MKKHSIGLGVALVLVFGLPACSRDTAPASSGVAVLDSAGATIVDNGRVDDAMELLATALPLVEIGVVDGPEEYQLFEVSDAKRLADGGFAAANGGTRELKIYDADGTHRATVGGSGQGPSEFGYPIAVRVLGGDTILVQDRYDRVYFTSSGEFINRETTDRQAMAELMGRIGGNSEGGQWLSDGTFFAPVYEWDQGPPVPGPPFRPAMTFVRVSGDLLRVDTLGEFGGIRQQYVDVGNERPSATVPPFSRNTSWGLGAADGTVVAADNAVSQIEIFHPDGRHTIARWRAAPEPVTGREVEEWKDQQRNASWTQSRLPQLERAWAAMDVPDAKPYFGRAGTGSDGRTWVGPNEISGEGWIAVELDGRVAGVAGVPGSFVPMDSGPGWLLGIFHSDQEVEFLRLYRLVED